MNKKRVLLIVAVLLILAAIITAAVFVLNGDTEKIPQITGSTEPLPGLEESIFDDEFDDETVSATDDRLNSVPESTDVEPDEDSNQPDANESDTPSQPSQDSGMVSEVVPEAGSLSYEDYYAMSAQAQRDYMESFENIQDFFDWYYEAKEAYETAHPDVVIGDGVIDLDELMTEE